MNLATARAHVVLAAPTTRRARPRSCGPRCSAPATRRKPSTPQRAAPRHPGHATMPAGAWHWPRCSARRWRCRWWATCSARTGCCRPGCSSPSPRRCSSGSVRASTAPAGRRSWPAAATWTCWWRSAPARPMASASCSGGARRRAAGHAAPVLRERRGGHHAGAAGQVARGARQAAHAGRARSAARAAARHRDACAAAASRRACRWPRCRSATRSSSAPASACRSTAN